VAGSRVRVPREACVPCSSLLALFVGGLLDLLRGSFGDVDEGLGGSEEPAGDRLTLLRGCALSGSPASWHPTQQATMHQPSCRLPFPPFTLCPSPSTPPQAHFISIIFPGSPYYATPDASLTQIERRSKMHHVGVGWESVRTVRGVSAAAFPPVASTGEPVAGPRSPAALPIPRKADTLGDSDISGSPEGPEKLASSAEFCWESNSAPPDDCCPSSTTNVEVGCLQHKKLVKYISSAWFIMHVRV
jgi:hypothetical protein